MKEKRIMD